MSSKLLFNSPPVVFSMELAVAVGVTEAIILQQIHYWCEKNRIKGRNYHDEHYWCYNSMTNWLKEYPCFSRSTLDRTFSKLRKEGLLITGNYNKDPMDRTLWYRIDYDALENYLSVPFLQNDEMHLQVLNRPIPENNNTENIKNNTNKKNRFSAHTAQKTCDEFYIDNENGDEVSLTSFISWYYAAYLEHRGEQHPFIREKQKQRVIEELTNFLSEDSFLGISYEGLQTMAEYFFEYGDSNDWRINHFAGYETLKWLCYEVLF